MGKGREQNRIDKGYGQEHIEEARTLQDVFLLGGTFDGRRLQIPESDLQNPIYIQPDGSHVFAYSAQAEVYSLRMIVPRFGFHVYVAFFNPQLP